MIFNNSIILQITFSITVTNFHQPYIQDLVGTKTHRPTLFVESIKSVQITHGATKIKNFDKLFFLKSEKI